MFLWCLFYFIFLFWKLIWFFMFMHRDCASRAECGGKEAKAKPRKTIKSLNGNSDAINVGYFGILESLNVVSVKKWRQGKTENLRELCTWNPKNDFIKFLGFIHKFCHVIQKQSQMTFLFQILFALKKKPSYCR